MGDDRDRAGVGYWQHAGEDDRDGADGGYRGTRYRRDTTGGAAGNERLTALTGMVLLVLLAAEGVTILSVRRLLTLHFFVGMLLIGPVVLKVCSTGYRFVRYYTGAAAYRRKGPPAPLLRLLGPVVLLTSVAVIGTGVMLALAGPGGGAWLLLHKASFVLWFGAMTVHVLAYVWRLPRLARADLAGRAGRRASEVLAGRAARVAAADGVGPGRAAPGGAYGPPRGRLGRVVRPGALMRDTSHASPDADAPQPGTSPAGLRLRGAPARRGLAPLIGAALAGWLAVGCGGHVSPPSASSSHAAPASSSAGPPAAAHAVAPGGVSKILVIMEENHSAGEVFPTGMPYPWHLARRYGSASDYSAITHPSLPNYLAIFTGSAFNDPPDCSPGPGCSYPGPSVFGQALARGKTARAYQESMPVPCDHSDGGTYAVRHNPWAYIPAEAAACRAGDVPAGTPSGGALASDTRAGALPSVGLLTPNLIHDAHDGTLGQADAYLRQWIPVIMSGPDWRHRRLAIAIVFDEGDTTNQVPFVLIAPGLSGTVIRQPLDHYALTRLIDTIIGAPPLRQAAGAPNPAQHLGLKLH